MQDYMREHTAPYAPPVNAAKPHNYLLVDVEGSTHYLDRYSRHPNTLCSLPAQLSEVEHDPMGYSMGAACDDCVAELTRRVLG